MKLTLEEALRLHREMWGDMQRELGDCPKGYDRENFKINWCEERFPEQSICCSSYKGYGEIYKNAPISEILALPEREFKNV